MKRFKIGFMGIVFLLVTLLIISGCGATQIPIDPEKQMPNLIRPGVVRVVCGNSMNFSISEDLSTVLGLQRELTYGETALGSGALISEKGYIVTNAHVAELAKLEDKDAKERISKKFLADMYQRLLKYYSTDKAQLIVKNYIPEYTKTGELKRIKKIYMPGGDNYTFDVKSYGGVIGEGKDVAVLKIDPPENVHLPMLLIDDTDKITTGDKVKIAGYPGNADLNINDVLKFDEKSIMTSTVQNGSIAARKTTDNGPILQLDATLDHGISGGPVVSTDGKIVGIATAGTNAISWAIPSSTILEFARQAGSPINQTSVITQRWQEGLDLFWQQYYKKAIPKFEEVKRLYPKHYAIEDFISKSQKEIEDGKDRKDLRDYLPWLIEGGVVVVVIIVVILLIILRRKPKKPVTVTENGAESSGIDKI